MPLREVQVRPSDLILSVAVALGLACLLAALSRHAEIRVHHVHEIKLPELRRK